MTTNTSQPIKRQIINDIKKMKNRILIALLFISTLTFGQEKNKILTLGTFHFHLVKSQFGVDFDINNKDKQKELTEIIKQIENYAIH